MLACVLGLAACSSYKGPLSCVSHLGIDGTITMIDVTETVQKEIVTALNSGEWTNDVTNCGHDYEFTIQSQTIRYHSECGTFIDITNGRSLSLSETSETVINELLGANH